MSEHDPAKARYYFMSLHRLIGGVLVLLGLMVVSETLDWSPIVGYALLVVGLLDFFIAPLIFARMWRTPKE